MPSDIKVFISYAHDDESLKNELIKHLSALKREKMISIWHDKAIGAGTEWESTIARELDEASIILLLVSASFIHSDYCYGIELTRALDKHSAGTARVIPILLRPVDWTTTPFARLQALPPDGVPVTSYSNRDEAFSKIAKGIRTVASELAILHTGVALHHQSHSKKSPKSASDSRHLLDMFRKMYVFLLIDQLENGVWGASMEGTAALYGHSEDPGSITVSTLSALAVTNFTGSRYSPSIGRYRSYLLSRRSPCGAFGMKKAMGSAKFPSYVLLKNRRHTATALQFFLFYDGPEHPLVKDALDYLFDNRTPAKLWTDVGEPCDERVDPVTVAFIVNALEATRIALLNDSAGTSQSVALDQIEDAIALGLDFIFKTAPRTAEHCWSYQLADSHSRQSDYQYVYSTDVLSSVVKACIRTDRWLSELDSVLTRLFKVAEYHHGLPSSPVSNIPNLDGTSRLIYAGQQRPTTQEKAAILHRQLPDICDNPEIIRESNAAGWSGILLLYGGRDAPFDVIAHSDAQKLEQIARTLVQEDPTQIAIPNLVAEHGDFIRELLVRRRMLSAAQV
jgi:hypothetical protein